MSPAAGPNPRKFIPLAGITSFVVGILFILAGDGRRTYAELGDLIAEAEEVTQEQAELAARARPSRTPRSCGPFCTPLWSPSGSPSRSWASESF